MPSDELVRRCKEIQRDTGRTFYFATRLLPTRVRHPTYVLYAFFRIADEVVDGDQANRLTPDEQEARLEDLRQQALGEIDPTRPELEAFIEVKEEYDIPDQEIDVFIDAMQTDIDKDRYESFEELRTYMRGSAAAVGVMMTAIMEPENRDRALPHARALGEAFQMSNFLRDVREDIIERDRIYLPQETLDRHGVTPGQIERLEFSPGFAAAVRDELNRTERLYREGIAGIKHLPDDCQFPVLLASVLYADYHSQIRAVNCDVLTNEPGLSTLRKLSLFARTGYRWKLSKDPESVFRSVSDLTLPDSTARPPEPGETLPIR